MERKIFYLCNGEKEDCKKRNCYKKGGICKHVKDVKYAKNFASKYQDGENSTLWERE